MLGAADARVHGAVLRGADASEQVRPNRGVGGPEVVGEVAVIIPDVQIADLERRAAANLQFTLLFVEQEPDLGVLGGKDPDPRAPRE